MTAATQYGLARAFGHIPDGYNAFTVVFRPPAPVAPAALTPDDLKRTKARQAALKQNAARKGMTLAKRAALSMRSPAERKADREAGVLAYKPVSGFNSPIQPVVMAGSSMAAPTAQGS